MFDFIRQFPWVLDTYRYPDPMTLLAEFEERALVPAEAKANLALKK